MTNAMILLGGLGSRLRPLTVNRPKPLVPVLNRPLIAYQIDLLKKFGIRRVILALGHKAGHFRRHLGSGKKFGVHFIYSQEHQPLGTAGAIRHALPHVNGPVFVLNGDVMSDFDLKGMARLHFHRKADATLALVNVEDPTPFGLVETDGRGRIRRFIEKPSGDNFSARSINAGCYFFEPRVVERIPAQKVVSIEREIFPALLDENFRVESFLHTGYWSDIGTLRSYWATHRDLLQHGLWGAGQSKPRWSSRVMVHGTVHVGKNVRVSSGAVFVGHVTLGHGVVVGEAARVENSVLLNDVRVGARAHVEQSVVGEGVVIRPDCRVGPGAVLGDRTMLTEFSQQLVLG